MKPLSNNVNITLDEDAIERIKHPTADGNISSNPLSFNNIMLFNHLPILILICIIMKLYLLTICLFSAL